MNVEELGRLFTTFERSAFRLETLGQYLVAEEATEFADFQAGRPLARRTPDNDQWLRTIAEDQIVVRMCYDDDGRWLGAEHAPDTDLDDYRHRRDLALAHAVPLNDYLAMREGSSSA